MHGIDTYIYGATAYLPHACTVRTMGREEGGGRRVEEEEEEEEEEER